MTGDARLTGIAHSASTLQISFRASGSHWQGGSDESYALDNLTIRYATSAPGAAVPEPGSLLLMGLGLVGLLAGVRRSAA